ncbi:hypothetical protein QQ045_004836 [Rhodiola kirilowii]
MVLPQMAIFQETEFEEQKVSLTKEDQTLKSSDDKSTRWIVVKNRKGNRRSFRLQKLPALQSNKKHIATAAIDTEHNRSRFSLTTCLLNRSRSTGGLTRAGTNLKDLNQQNGAGKPNHYEPGSKGGVSPICQNLCLSKIWIK